MTVVMVSSDVLDAELRRYLASSEASGSDEHRAAAEHGLLPLFSDFVGCWALSLAGELVFVPWDEPHRVEIVSGHSVNAVGTNAALAQGSMRYPALASIRPVRPADAVPCTACDGSGRLPNAPENLLCACAGLGWLPASAPGTA
jgi:hypothetical protein